MAKIKRMMFKMKTKFKTLFEISPENDIDAASTSGGGNIKSMPLSGRGSGSGSGDIKLG